MPNFAAVCGVRPNCAKTGMPSPTNARTTSGNSAAASTLIMSAPPSLMSLNAAARALSMPCCTGPYGMSQLTSARSTPRRLAADQHFVERDFDHLGPAPQIDADRIADRDEIESGAVGDARELIVPGDDDDALFSLALHLLERGNGDLGGHAASLPPCGSILFARCRVSAGWAKSSLDAQNAWTPH